MSLRRPASGLALAACLVHAAGAFAQAPVIDGRDLDERLKRLERLLDSQSLLKLFEEVESLGADVRELRGQLEVQSHTIDQLQDRLRERYLDVDRRLQRVESAPQPQAAGARQPAVPAPAAPGAPETAAQPTPAPAVPQPTAQPSAIAAAEQAPAALSEPPSVDPFEEQQAYTNAFNLLKSGRYEDAAAAFRQFIAAYPAGSYAGNAQYWLGETHYVTRKFDLAMQEFQRLVSNYPVSTKLPGALLKIGYIHDELGNKAEAERVLNDLRVRYQDSAAAKLALKKLQEIRGQ